jgi:hypothetical protein
MDDYRIEEAFDIMAQIKGLESCSSPLLDALLLASERLELLRALSTGPNGKEALGRSWRDLAWQRVIEATRLAELHAERETLSRPGCLPEDYPACEMMGLVFCLRRAALDCSSFIGEVLD